MNDEVYIDNGYPFKPHNIELIEEEEMISLSDNHYKHCDKRRSVRHFSNRQVDRKVIENIILAASTAPSGAHKQPWTFCVVSNPELKSQIRIAAEEEERRSYGGRMSEEWKADLAPLGTDWHKPFLEDAPYLIVVFRRSFEYEGDHKHTNYYVQESVGLACGILLTAIHRVGLAALTHTPSPMNFLSRLLQRPDNEKPYLLIPVGYPADTCIVPDLRRKSLHDISVWYD